MFDLKGKYEHVFLSILNKYIYALIRSSTEHKLFMYLTSSIIIKRHKHQIFWDQLARRAANNRKSKQRRGNNVL
jgi:hypothetical protein